MTRILADIESIAETIWDALFQSSLVPGGEGDLSVDSQVTCVVHLHGAFQGAVMIQCPEALGAKLTAAMTQDAETGGADDMVDALGELTNVFAGNLKALLPKPSSISLPTVAFGPHYQLGVVGANVVARVPFLCDEHPFVVTVLQRSNEGRRET